MKDPELPDTSSGLSPDAQADVRTVAKGGGIQIAGQVVGRLLAFGFTFVTVALVGTAGYGLYRQIAQVLAIAGQLGLAGFNYAAMRFIAKARAAGDHGGVRGAARVAIRGALVASAVVLIGIFVAAVPLSEAFAKDRGDAAEFARVLRIGAAYIPLFAAMQVLRYCTQAYKTMGPSVMVGSIIQPAARFVLGIGALIAGFEVPGLVGSFALSVAVGVLAGAWYFRRMLSPDELAASPSFRVGEVIRFAIPQGGSSLLGIQALGLGVILLGLYQSDFQVGLFGVALALQGPGTIFLSGIVNIWAPVVADLHAMGEIARLESLYQTITRWVATFSFPAFAALILEPDLFLNLFAPKATQATGVVAILAVGNFFYTGTGPTGYVISMTGRPGVNFANSIVAVLLYALLGILIVPAHGAVGMAVVDSVVTAVINTVRVIEAKILVGVQPFGRPFLKPVGATALGALALLLWRLIPGDGVPLELSGVVVAGIIYVGALKVMKLDPEERYVWQQIKARSTLGRGRRGTR